MIPLCGGLARQAGLEFPDPRSVPSTRAAHALLGLAKKPDVKNPLIERIYQAYFRGRKDIGQVKILIDLASAFEIPSDPVQAALSDPRLEETLEARRGDARRRGFLGLPGFVYRGKNYFGAPSRDARERIRVWTEEETP